MVDIITRKNRTIYALAALSTFFCVLWLQSSRSSTTYTVIRYETTPTPQPTSQYPYIKSNNKFKRRDQSDPSPLAIDPTTTPLSDQCIIFWHVTKTGGTTLRHILLREATARGRTVEHMDEFATLPGDITFGHVGPGRIIQLLENGRAEERRLKGGKQCYWLTSNRDPLERFISRFYFRREWGPSLEDFVRSGDPALRTFPLFNNRNLLDRTLNLLDEFDLILLSERFDESLILLVEEDHVLSHNALNYTSYGVIQGRPKQDDLPADVRARLRELLALDLRYYEATQRHLERRIERFGVERMRERLEDLQRWRGEPPCAKPREALVNGSGACKNFGYIAKQLQKQAEGGPKS
ncbi:hypothetical protein QOT17_023365 [Balamuthia mandrillaris]